MSDGPLQSFPVDPANPGEVLACAGLARLAARIGPEAASGFVRHSDRWHFEIPFDLHLLRRIDTSPLTVADDQLQVDGLRLDWWQEGWGLNPEFKFWAGQQTPQSVLNHLLRASRNADPRDWQVHLAPTSGRLGVDPLGAWDSLELGWSINEHKDFRQLCRPCVEWLAFIALQCFPVRGDRHHGFRYHLWRPARLELAVLAFAGSGRHALHGYRAETDKSGSNTYLKTATPLQE